LLCRYAKLVIECVQLACKCQSTMQWRSGVRYSCLCPRHFQQYTDRGVGRPDWVRTV
jgi:hypothetical protein